MRRAPELRRWAARGGAVVVSVRRLLEPELAWANERYEEVHFLLSSANDFLAVAEVDGEKVGLGRLVPVNATTGELGGMYVLPAFRGRKIAGAIVSYLLLHSPYRQLFCIPFAHLDGFYAGFGFHPVPAETAVPCAVVEKVNWCTKEYPASVHLLMRVENEAAPRSLKVEVQQVSGSLLRR